MVFGKQLLTKLWFLSVSLENSAVLLMHLRSTAAKLLVKPKRHMCTVLKTISHKMVTFCQIPHLFAWLCLIYASSMYQKTPTDRPIHSALWSPTEPVRTSRYRPVGTTQSGSSSWSRLGSRVPCSDEYPSASHSTPCWSHQTHYTQPMHSLFTE